MYCLEVIHSMNRRAASAPKHETEWSRHCSYHQTKTGIVLHSAKLRSTAFLSNGPATKKFLVDWFGTNSATRRDQLVEAYF